MYGFIRKSNLNTLKFRDTKSQHTQKMNNRTIYLGDTLVKSGEDEINGKFVDIQNEKFYKISNSNQMPDFFMTIVSDSDHWMFLSSNGALSAGRKNRNNALFPYYTVDKIHDSKGKTGSQTILLVEKPDRTFLWEPFSDQSENIYSIERNLYKSIYGNKFIFEEINHDLGLQFQYGWYFSEKFGIVKKSEIKNLNQENIGLEILDGIKNILPNGIDFDFQNNYSNLLDAYKKNELIVESQLGLFMLSSIPVDRAEPSEALKTTTVWSHGLNTNQNTLISERQTEKFKQGQNIQTETDIRASRGAYFIHTKLNMAPDSKQDWMLVAEINQDSTAVANLNNWIKTEKDIKAKVQADIELGTENLKRIVANADGIQITNEELSSARHFSNTLFSVMRGGIFTSNYDINVADFKLFVNQMNKSVSTKFEVWLNELPEKIHITELISQAAKSNNSDLIRICYEYLPLTFSRRHGDPSRPWNQFSIETKNDDGSPKLNYQGNWRDIFQNWEALGLSFPEFLEGMICKFLNATTADGYNPYRITREGIDWEAPDPHDPWAYIGYWGDHQIIYLQKFLELSNEFHPGKLNEFLEKEIFAYANVPYRIKPYTEIVKNPKDTILFDAELDRRVKQITKQTGADGCLLRNAEEQIYRVNLTEKILVTLLAKLSNFIPEAGIWLNTQRPEWNDANNALVGNGVSMVTLYYLRRYLKFWSERFKEMELQEILVSEEVKTLFDNIHRVFAENTDLLAGGFSDSNRRRMTDELGEAGSNYRNSVYKNSFSGKKKPVTVQSLLNFTRLSLDYMDQSIRVNKRDDGLYHAYNLISFSDESIAIRNLYEMLEGQVAVLSSGYLSVNESLEVLNVLKASKLFREDQYSYLLYPDRQLPLFVQKNTIPAEKVNGSKLLSRLLADQNSSILTKDELGNYHFNGSFRNVGVLQSTLDQLSNPEYQKLLSEEKEQIMGIYEELFDHQSFTGRSGTFYGYEGLGSIYWHMVSKLLLATQENYFRGVEEQANPEILGKIKDHYYEIKAGIGLYKSPELYGAFPTDAYSHTPGNAGAQQPGMTGQVKEDFICRMREVGVHVQDGKISFQSGLMNHNELLQKELVFEYYDLKGLKQYLPLQKSQLGFTFCQLPVCYNSSQTDEIIVTTTQGQLLRISGHELPSELSKKVFDRSGEFHLIEVYFSNLS